MLRFCGTTAPGGRSGTDMRIQMDTATASTASRAKMPRQPSSGTAHCTGTVALMPPMPARNSPAPVTAATRCFGYHCVLALSIAISPAASPKPQTMRPSASTQTSGASALITKPAAETSASVLCTLRGPCRSSAMPIGNCASA